MTDRSERVRSITPEDELNRRWTAVRTEMARRDIDALVVHNHVDNIGGYVKYFCDVSSVGGYPLTVVFPQNEPMTMVTVGPQNGDRRISPDDDPLLYGVHRILSAPFFGSVSYTRTYDAAQTLRALQPYADGRIGLVGLAQLPHAFLSHLEAELPHATFCDAAELVDPIKATKSDYEMQCIERTMRMQRRVFEACLDAIQPGRREWEITTVATHVARQQGSPGGLFMIGSAPPGEPAARNSLRNQNRQLRQGDTANLLIEIIGPDGYFAEVGRTVVIGEASDSLLKEYEFTRQAWSQGVAALRPGASASELFRDYNDFMRQHGRPEERRLHSHSQGYDIVERPLLATDESMTIAPDMFLAYHPQYVYDDQVMWLCDNVVIGPDGPSGPLHDIEQKVFEL